MKKGEEKKVGTKKKSVSKSKNIKKETKKKNISKEEFIIFLALLDIMLSSLSSGILFKIIVDWLNVYYINSMRLFLVAFPMFFIIYAILILAMILIMRDEIETELNKDE